MKTFYSNRRKLEVSTLIRDARGDRSQEWLASKTQCKIPVISYIENGWRTIPKKKIILFAKALKLKPSQLLPDIVIDLNGG